MSNFLLSLLESVPDPVESDTFGWMSEDSGQFMVNLCYMMLSSEMHEYSSYEALGAALTVLWKTKISSNFFIFVWRILLSRIPSEDQLFKRGILNFSRGLSCVFCFASNDNLSHLFFNCPISKKFGEEWNYG